MGKPFRKAPKRARAGARNAGCAPALRTLKEHFATETSPGPVKARPFVLGPMTPGESADLRFQRTALRQDMVDAAGALLGAAT